MSFPAPRQRAGGTAQGRPGSLARPGSRVHYGKPNQGSSNEKRAPVLYLVQQTKSRKFKRKKGAGSLSGSSRNGRRTAQRARAGTASRRLPALRRGRPGRRPAGAPAVITFVRQTLCPSNTSETHRQRWESTRNSNNKNKRNANACCQSHGRRNLAAAVEGRGGDGVREVHGHVGHPEAHASRPAARDRSASGPLSPDRARPTAARRRARRHAARRAPRAARLRFRG